MLYRVGVALILAILTQVGALSYLLSLGLCHLGRLTKRSVKVGLHIVCYLLMTFVVMPPLAGWFGREPVVISANLKPANYWITVGLNRNYVVPELNQVLSDVAETLAADAPDIVVLFLDASFPFMDGFPLLPHLSHNNGRKIDLAYFYQDTNGQLVDYSVARSGYGYFEHALEGERDTNQFCKDHGYFQYDYPKYLTMGTRPQGLSFSIHWNMRLIEAILAEGSITRIFVEPHLVTRLGIENDKVRFHGCRAVRHDDHIHIEI